MWSWLETIFLNLKVQIDEFNLTLWSCGKILTDSAETVQRLTDSHFEVGQKYWLQSRAVLKRPSTSKK
jgi:hypothetical protein